MLLQRLALQRRRLYLAVFFAYLSGVIGLGSVLPGLGAMLPAARGAGVSVPVLVICSGLIMLAPTLRSVAESLGAGLLSLALILSHPSFGPGQLPLWGVAAMLIALTALWHVALHGRWWARLPLRLDWRVKRRFRLPFEPAAIWARLVPDPDRPEAHYSGTFLGERAVPDRPGWIIQRTRTDGGAVRETTLRIEVRRPPERLVYRYNADRRDKACDYRAGRFALTLTAEGDQTLIEIEETVSGLVVPTALELWLDDLGGEIRASMRAALTGQPDGSLWLGTGRRPMRVAARGPSAGKAAAP